MISMIFYFDSFACVCPHRGRVFLCTLDLLTLLTALRNTQAWWLGGMTFFATLYQVVKSTDPESKNPAVNRKMNMVGEDPIELGGWKKLVETEK